MQKSLKKQLNRLLNLKGHSIVPIYEILHLEEKNKEMIQEISNYFFSTLGQKIVLDKTHINLISQLYGTGVVEAFYIISYLRRSLSLEGDVCEFGIANGATSTLLAYEIKNSKKNLWLFDSFEGLSQPTEEDTLIHDIFKFGTMKKYQGSMSYPVKDVTDRLKRIKFSQKRVKIIKGFIEDSLMKKQNLPKKIAFAYIDFDLYQPIRTTLFAIDHKLVQDGVLIIDDYGYFSSGVKKAVDEFVDQKDYTVITPSYSDGHFIMIIKK